MAKDTNGLCIPLTINYANIEIKSSKPGATITAGAKTLGLEIGGSTTSTKLSSINVSSIIEVDKTCKISDIKIESGKEIAIASNGDDVNITLQNCTINSDGFSYSQTLTSSPRGVYNSLICMLRSSTSKTTNLTLDNCNITMKNAVSATAVITYLDRQNSSKKGFGSLVVKGGTKITTCNDIPIFDLYETEDTGNNKVHNEYNMPNIHDRTTHCLVLEECSFNQSLDSKTGTILDPTSTNNTGTDWFVEKVGYSKFKYYEPYFNLTDCIADGYKLQTKNIESVDWFRIVLNKVTSGTDGWTDYSAN